MSHYQGDGKGKRRTRTNHPEIILIVKIPLVLLAHMTALDMMLFESSLSSKERVTRLAPVMRIGHV